MVIYSRGFDGGYALAIKDVVAWHRGEEQRHDGLVAEGRAADRLDLAFEAKVSRRCHRQSADHISQFKPKGDGK